MSAARPLGSISARLPKPPSIWGRAALLALSLSLLLGYVLATSPHDTSGNWTSEATFHGTLVANSSDEQRLSVTTPASFDRDGLRFEAKPIELTLRPRGPLDAAPYDIMIHDSDGRMILTTMIDPSNPMSVPMGPATTRLSVGEYRILITPQDARGGSYELVATVTMPFHAQRQGLALHPATLLAPAGVAAALALLPPLRVLRRFSLSRAPQGEFEHELNQP